MIIDTIIETINYYLCVWRPYDVMNGREYLECGYPTYKLLDAWLTSDDPKKRKQAESIDEEGNNVLVRIRLKNKIADSN